MGADLWLCGPATLFRRDGQVRANVTNDIREAVRDADVVMMLRIQLERQKTAYFPSFGNIPKYGLNGEFSLWRRRTR